MSLAYSFFCRKNVYLASSPILSKIFKPLKKNYHRHEKNFSHLRQYIIYVSVICYFTSFSESCSIRSMGLIALAAMSVSTSICGYS